VSDDADVADLLYLRHEGGDYIDEARSDTMSRMRVTILTLALLLGGLASGIGAPSAHAQSKPDYAAARKHYMNAQQAEKAGDYDTAVSEYAAAYDITKDAKILYSVAKAYEGGGNKDAAVVYYRRYVNEAKDAKDRDEVKKHITELEGAPTPPPTNPTPPPPDKGNQVIAPTPPAPTGPPPAGGETDVVIPGQGIGDAPALSDGGSRWQRTAGWASVGVAAVLFTTGAVLGVSANSRAEDIDRLETFRDHQGNPTRYTGNVKADYENAQSDGKSLEKYSIVAFSVAGAAAVAAVIFFAIDPGAPESPEAVSQSHRYFVPVISQDAVGVAAGWGF
jgi:tetratricopeptide (TPR) repeat protein